MQYQLTNEEQMVTNNKKQKLNHEHVQNLQIRKNTLFAWSKLYTVIGLVQR